MRSRGRSFRNCSSLHFAAASSCWRSCNALKRLVREPFGAIDLRRLAHRLERPDRLRGAQVRIVDRLEEVRARHVQAHRVAARHDREIEFLRIDQELVAPELDGVLAAAEEILPILELAHRILADRLQPAAEIVRLDRVAEFDQLLGEVAHLLDHRVRREVAIQLIEARGVIGAMLDPLQDALRGGEQTISFAIARLDELELPLLERAG